MACINYTGQDSMRASKKGYGSIALSRRRRKWTKKFFDNCIDFTNMASLLMFNDNTGHHGHFYLRLSFASPLPVQCIYQLHRPVRSSSWPCTTTLLLRCRTTTSSGSSTHSCSTPTISGRHAHARRRRRPQWQVGLRLRRMRLH